MLQQCKAVESTWLHIFSIIGVNHKGPGQIKSVSFSLFFFLLFNKTRHSCESSFRLFTLLHRWEKDADGVLPPLQQWGHGLSTPSRSVYQWIDWTYQLQVILKLQWVISIHSSTQEHLLFLNEFPSPLPDRRNMLLSCCSVFKATLPW